MEHLKVDLDSNFEHRTKLVTNVLKNMHEQVGGSTNTSIILAGDPGVGKCLSGENEIELFIKNESLYNELQKFLNEQTK